MHDHLPNLRPLAAQGIRPHGKARPGPVRPGQSLDFLPAPAPVREPQTSGRGCAGCPRQVAQSQISRVIAVTANSWGVSNA